MSLRVLVGPVEVSGGSAAADLDALYAAPDNWLRANMVTTLDGSATGADGRSGSINNDVDKRVFHALRRQADAIVVGAGTARAENYRPTDRPIVVVSRSGSLPEQLYDGDALLVTRGAAPGLADSQARLGNQRVLVLGDEVVDLSRLRPVLAARGLTRLLCEGGPSLLADLVAVGVVDELCATIVPTLVGGDHPRILHGAPVETTLELTLLLEAEGTLLGRWRIARADSHQGEGS